MTAQEGAWSTSKTNGDIDVETYRVGSNERLVFTQDVYPKTSGAVAHLAVASIPENELRAAFPKGTWTSELSGYELSGVSDGATGVQIADGSRQPVTHQLIIETGDGVLPGTTIDLDGIQYVATATE